MVVSAANSAARKRPRTSDQGPRAVEDQAVQAAPRPGGPDSDEHGSELRANADPNPGSSNGLAAVDLDEADLDSDADLETRRSRRRRRGPDRRRGPPGRARRRGSRRGRPQRRRRRASRRSGRRPGRGRGQPGRPGCPGRARGGPAVRAGAPEPRPPSRRAPPSSRSRADGTSEDEEIFVFGDDDDDLPAAQVAVAGATADPVKDYLKQIGKVPAAQRRAGGRAGQADRGGPVRRGEAGRAREPAPRTRASTWSGSPRTAPGPRTTCWRRTSGWWCRWPSGIPGGGCCSWT